MRKEGSKNILPNMRQLSARNVEAKTKKDPCGTIATTTNETKKILSASFKSNLQTKVVPKKTNSTKQTTCKRNSRRNKVMIDEPSVGKENRTKKLKTAKSKNDEFSVAANTSTPKLLQPAGRQMNLRPHVNKNYRESPLVRSPSEPKVPIYLQKLQNIGTKKHGDPYEPDFVSEDKLQKRRNPSEQYDDTYNELLMQLEKKEEIKKKKAIATARTLSYKKNLENVMERIMLKVNKKKQKVESTEHPKTPVENESQVLFKETRSISHNPTCQTNSLYNAPSVQIENIEIADGDTSRQLHSSTSSAEIISQVLIPLDLHHTSRMHPDISVNCSRVTQDSVPPDFCDDSQNEIDEHIDCSQGTPESIILDFCNGPPDKVVKPVNSRHVTYRSSPYRLTCFRPSPYYMYCKPNGLPCLHQDLIMDYDFVTRYGRPPEPKYTKELVQSSMLHYVKVSGDKENILKVCTLYDIEEFSTSPVKNVREIGDRVLRSRMEPNVLVSTPKKAGIGDEDIAALDISVIQHEVRSRKEEGVVIEVETQRRLIENEGAPRQYTRSSLNQPTDDRNEEIGGKLFDGVDPEFLENIDDQVPDLKGKKRRNQFVSDETMVEDGRRKRKKDEMTKEEKKQFEKWAKEFNEMCAEVEKHQLQIV